MAKNKKMVDVKEVLKLLRVSLETLRKWRNNENCNFPKGVNDPKFHPYNKLYWDKAEVVAWNKKRIKRGG